MMYEEEYYPSLLDMLVPSVLCGVCLCVVRKIYEIFIVMPIGKTLGLSDDSQSQQKQFSKHVSENNNCHLTNGKIKKTDVRKEDLQKVMTKNGKKQKASTLKRFCDSSWQFLFFMSSFWAGIYLFWDKSWLFDFMQCFDGFPNQSVSKELYWFYLIELGFYWSSIFSIPYDHKRKDFKANVIHHVATIIVMILSWNYNYCRVGATVLLIHDAADSWLAAGKMANYCKRGTLSEVFFIGFVVVWTLTRLCYFPFVVIYCILYKVPYVDDPITVAESQSTQYAVCRSLLYVLQVLHLIWTYMIIQTALPKFRSEKRTLKDSSSDTEEEDEDESEETTNQKLKDQ